MIPEEPLNKDGTANASDVVAPSAIGAPGDGPFNYVTKVGEYYIYANKAGVILGNGNIDTKGVIVTMCKKPPKYGDAEVWCASCCKKEKNRSLLNMKSHFCLTMLSAIFCFSASCKALDPGGKELSRKRAAMLEAYAKKLATADNPRGLLSDTIELIEFGCIQSGETQISDVVALFGNRLVASEARSRDKVAIQNSPKERRIYVVRFPDTNAERLWREKVIKAGGVAPAQLPTETGWRLELTFDSSSGRMICASLLHTFVDEQPSTIKGQSTKDVEVKSEAANSGHVPATTK